MEQRPSEHLAESALCSDGSSPDVVVPPEDEQQLRRSGPDYVRARQEELFAIDERSLARIAGWAALEAFALEPATDDAVAQALGYARARAANGYSSASDSFFGSAMVLALRYSTLSRADEIVIRAALGQDATAVATFEQMLAQLATPHAAELQRQLAALLADAPAYQPRPRPQAPAQRSAASGRQARQEVQDQPQAMNPLLYSPPMI